MHDVVTNCAREIRLAAACALAVAFSVACKSADESAAPVTATSGGSSNAGGAVASNGGVGGTTASTGGFANAGGAVNPGGSPNAGGATSTGGTSNTGGTPSMGGSNAGGASTGGSGAGGAPGTGGATSDGGSWWKPPAGVTWDWQLSSTDLSYSVAVYDIDWENGASAVASLHAKGIFVICYVSVGSWEDFRPDQASFPTAVIGNDYPGWPG